MFFFYAPLIVSVFLALTGDTQGAVVMLGTAAVTGAIMERKP